MNIEALKKRLEFDEVAAQGVANACTNWHGCATGDCPHEKYAECFDAIHVYAQGEENARLRPIIEQMVKVVADCLKLRDIRREYLEGLAEAGDVDHAIINLVTGPLAKLEKMVME